MNQDRLEVVQRKHELAMFAIFCNFPILSIACCAHGHSLCKNVLRICSYFKAKHKLTIPPVYPQIFFYATLITNTNKHKDPLGAVWGSNPEPPESQTLWLLNISVHTVLFMAHQCDILLLRSHEGNAVCLSVLEAPDGADPETLPSIHLPASLRPAPGKTAKLVCTFFRNKTLFQVQPMAFCQRTGPGCSFKRE